MHERLRRIASEDYEFVWRSLRRLGVRPPETDDAAQQVFIILPKKLESVDIGNERSYLFAIAVRVAANVRRRLQASREVPEDEVVVDPAFLPVVETNIDDERARAYLDEILARMSDDRRAVFILFELEELPLSEIAKILDIPMWTVASRLRRARADMRAAIARLRARSKGI